VDKPIWADVISKLAAVVDRLTGGATSLSAALTSRTASAAGQTFGMPPTDTTAPPPNAAPPGTPTAPPPPASPGSRSRRPRAVPRPRLGARTRPGKVPTLARVARGLSGVVGIPNATQLMQNPLATAAVSAGLLRSRPARLGLSGVMAARLGTRVGRARLAKGVRLAASSMGAGAKVATKLGAVAGLAGTVAGVAAAGLLFGKAVHGMTEEAVRAQARLAEVSGAMAAVMAERHAREVFRDVRQGERIAGTARGLVSAEQNLKDATEPIESLITNIKNTVLAGIEQTLADILTPVAHIAELIGRYFSGDPTDATMVTALRELADRTEAARRERDTSFVRPTVTRHRP
jgi:hypothetical protein